MPKVKLTKEEIRDRQREHCREYQRKLRLEHPDIVKETKRKAYIKFKETRSPGEAKKYNEKMKEWRRRWVLMIDPESLTQYRKQQCLATGRPIHTEKKVKNWRRD